MDCYGTPNPSQRKKSFVSPLLFPHSTWPSLLPAPNHHLKEKKKSDNKNPFCSLRRTVDPLIREQVRAAACFALLLGKAQKLPVKTRLVGKGGITLKSLSLFLWTLLDRA